MTQFSDFYEVVSVTYPQLYPQPLWLGQYSCHRDGDSIGPQNCPARLKRRVSFARRRQRDNVLRSISGPSPARGGPAWNSLEHTVRDKSHRSVEHNVLVSKRYRQIADLAASPSKMTGSRSARRVQVTQPINN